MVCIKTVQFTIIKFIKTFKLIGSQFEGLFVIARINSQSFATLDCK